MLDRKEILHPGSHGIKACGSSQKLILLYSDHQIGNNAAWYMQWETMWYIQKCNYAMNIVGAGSWFCSILFHFFHYLVAGRWVPLHRVLVTPSSSPGKAMLARHARVITWHLVAVVQVKNHRKKYWRAVVKTSNLIPRGVIGEFGHGHWSGSVLLKHGQDWWEHWQVANGAYGYITDACILPSRSG